MLKVRQIAKQLDISLKTVYKVIESGQLPALKIGVPGSKRPTIRVTEAALEKYILGLQ
jgi:excisionase family DNA binding protein